MYLWINESGLVIQVMEKASHNVYCYHDIVHTSIAGYKVNANMLVPLKNYNGNVLVDIRSNTVKPQ